MRFDESSSQFCQHIIDELNVGFGVIPFVGSGLSKQSGILTGKDFTNFLAFAVYQSIVHHHDIRTRGWPKYPRGEDMEIVRKWFLEQYRSTCERTGLSALPEDGNDIQSFAEKCDNAHGSLSSLLRSLKRPPVPELIQSRRCKADDTFLLQLLRSWKMTPAEFAADQQFSRNSKEFVIEQAMRSCYDWRATLDFLARIRLQSDEWHTVDETPDPSVFDSFNAHITRDRQPNLGHKMIAHLSRVCRSRLVLTTNFDPLIELSFARVERPVKEFSVSTQGNLPSEQVVFATDSIVKLHGSLMETRADFSLDTPPTDEDCARFAAYVSGAKGERPTSAQFRDNHLLVVGYSASDLRCVHMLKYLLDQNQYTQFFWICFNQHDRDRLETTFPESKYQNRVRIHINSQPDLLLYELYQRACIGLPSGGVSYQYTARLPAVPSSVELIKDKKRNYDSYKEEIENPKGADIDRFFEDKGRKDGKRDFIWYRLSEFMLQTLNEGKVPPEAEAYYRDHFLIKRVMYSVKEAQGAKDRKIEERDGANAIMLVRHGSGSIAASGQFLHACINNLGKQVVFIELQDHTDARGIVREILVSIALETGSFQTELVNCLPRHGWDVSAEDEELQQDFAILYKHMSALFLQLGIKADDWLVCLYGRGGYGPCASWGGQHGSWEKGPEGERNELHALWQSMQLLADTGMNIVYFPLDKERAEAESKKYDIVKKTANDWELRQCTFEKNDNISMFEMQFPFDKTDSQTFITYDMLKTPVWNNIPYKSSGVFSARIEFVIDKIIKPFVQQPDDEELRDKVSFLYAITLLRQSRHVSVLFSDAVCRAPRTFNLEGIDNDLVRYQHSKTWTEELVNAGVLHEKSGGFFWMHRDMRLSIQKLLESINLTELNGNSLSRNYKWLIEKRASFHRTIAEWNLRAFLTSGHWIPVIESMYHYRMAALHAPFASPGKWGILMGTGAVKAKATKGAEERLQKQLHQFQILHSSLNELLKLISISTDFLQFWMADSSGYKMFDACDEAIDETTDFLKANKKESNNPLANYIHKEANKKKLINELTQRLKHKLKRLGQQIANERDVSMSHEVDTSPFITVSRPQGGLVSNIEIPIGNLESTDAEWFNNTTSEKTWENFFADLDAWDWISKTHQLAMGIVDDHHRIAFDRNVRELRAKWAAEYADQPFQVLKMVEGLGEFAYEHLRRANLENDLLSLKGKVEEKPDCDFYKRTEHQTTYIKSDRIRKLRLCVAAFSDIGMSLCRHLDPIFHARESLLRAKFNTLHGLVHALLARFSESHRRLTEAQQYLTKSYSGGTLTLHVSIIRLRRAEAYMALARYLTNWLDELRTEGEENGKDFHTYFLEMCEGLAEKKGSRIFSDSMKQRLASAVIALERKAGPEDRRNKTKAVGNHLVRAIWAAIDDAASCLELAERQLSGLSQHSLWWGRLYTLKMELFYRDQWLRNECQKIPDSPRIKTYVQRKPIDHTHIAFEIRNLGLLATEHSPLRQLRILRHFADYVDEHQKGSEYNCSTKTIKGLMEQVQEIEDNLSRKMAGNPLSWQICQLLKRRVGEIGS